MSTEPELGIGYKRLAEDRGPTTDRPQLRIVDTGHWAMLDRGTDTLLSVSLDGDSIEGRRSPKAEERIELLVQLASAWEQRTVPVERTWDPDAEARRAVLLGTIARRRDGTLRPFLERLAKQAELVGGVHAAGATAPALRAYNCSYAEPGPWPGWTVSAARIEAPTPEAAKASYLRRLRERFPAAKEEAVHVRLDCQQPEAGVQP